MSTFKILFDKAFRNANPEKSFTVFFIIYIFCKWLPLEKTRVKIVEVLCFLARSLKDVMRAEEIYRVARFNSKEEKIASTACMSYW